MSVHSLPKLRSLRRMQQAEAAYPAAGKRQAALYVYPMLANSPFRKAIQLLVDERARIRAVLEDEDISHDQRSALYHDLHELDERIGSTFFWWSVNFPEAVEACPPTQASPFKATLGY